ncbi:hypothetical protein [Vibrio phage LV6]|nr:hypothetical protein [Vibrio phage LV6]
MVEYLLTPVKQYLLLFVLVLASIVGVLAMGRAIELGGWYLLLQLGFTVLTLSTLVRYVLNVIDLNGYHLGYGLAQVGAFTLSLALMVGSVGVAYVGYSRLNLLDPPSVLYAILLGVAAVLMFTLGNKLHTKLLALTYRQWETHLLQ